VTALADISQPRVIDIVLAENHNKSPVMQPAHSNVYDMWVEFMKVPFAMGFNDIIALVYSPGLVNPLVKVSMIKLWYISSSVPCSSSLNARLLLVFNS
jgi:hypothetical protein